MGVLFLKITKNFRVAGSFVSSAPNHIFINLNYCAARGNCAPKILRFCSKYVPN